MLIDKIIDKDWGNIKFFNGEKISIKNAIVFKVDESIDEFLNNKHPLVDKNINPKELILQSFLPFDNLVINYLDGIDWFYQVDFPKIKKKIITNIFFSHKTELPLVNKMIVETTPKPCISINYDYTSSNIGLFEQNGSFVMVNDIKKKYGEVGYSLTWGFVWGLLRFTNFLSCKNIIYEKITPPAKLQKKRKGKNKLPLLSYYILKLKLTSSKKQYEHKNLWSNRVHLCRGHVKTYTEEKPLFGNYVGNIWCPPHARGNKKIGVINKDYEM